MVDPPEIQWNQVNDELRELRYILYPPEVSIGLKGVVLNKET